MNSNSDETLHRLELVAARLETQVVHLEERGKKCDQVADRVVVLETRHDETAKQTTRQAQWWAIVSGVVTALLTKLYDVFAGGGAGHTAHH